MDNPGTINGDIWASLIKWGIVIAKPSLQRATLTSKRITQLYYINKIYYPIFNISCRFRGGFNFKVTDEIWDQMIRPAIAEPESYITKKKTKDKASEPSITSNPSVEEATTNIQLSMFDDLD